MSDRPDRTRRRRWGVADAYGAFVVRFRFAILIAWALGILATATLLPGLGTSGGGSSDVGGVVSASSPPIQAEIHSFTEFRFPLLSRVAVVQRDPNALDPYAQARAVLRALTLDQQAAGNARGLLGALPLTNTAALLPSSSERGTTAITFLFSSPSLSFSRQTQLATSFARSAIDRPDDHLVGVTGTVPGRVRQGRLISSALPTVEAATLVVILVLVAVSFRSLIAPVVTLLTAACAFLVTTHAAASIGQQLRGGGARHHHIHVPDGAGGRRARLLRPVRRGGAAGGARFRLQHLRRRPDLGSSARPAARPGDDRCGTARRPRHQHRPPHAALSFGLLVLVPLRPFRELAVAMTVGVLLDVFVARSLLVPSILTLMGPLSGWPSRRLLSHRAFHEARKATRHKSSQSGGRPWGQTLQTEPGQTDGVTRT